MQNGGEQGMDEGVSLSLLRPDGMRDALAEGRMVIARSKDNFMYILERESEFLMFTHTPGNPGGGRNRFPKDEKYTAVVRELGELADALYAADFVADLNLYGVMSAAEEGILSLFPGNDRDGDGEVEFVIRGGEKTEERLQ